MNSHVFYHCLSWSKLCRKLCRNKKSRIVWFYVLRVYGVLLNWYLNISYDWSIVNGQWSSMSPPPSTPPPPGPHHLHYHHLDHHHHQARTTWTSSCACGRSTTLTPRGGSSTSTSSPCSGPCGLAPSGSVWFLLLKFDFVWFCLVPFQIETIRLCWCCGFNS